MRWTRSEATPPDLSKQPGTGRIPELRTLFIDVALESGSFFFMPVWLKFNKVLGVLKYGNSF